MNQKKQDQINKIVKGLDEEIGGLENSKRDKKTKHEEVIKFLDEELELLNLKKEGIKKIK